MNDQDKTKDMLISQLTELRRQVAAHQRAEEELLQSSQRFRRVFEEAPCGVVLLGTDACVQQANPRLCKLLGYSEQEIIALGIAGITHPDDLEPDLRLASRLHRGEIPNYSIAKRYICKDGRVVWGQLTVSAMHDAEGRPTGSIRTIEDITERRRSEEALRESEGRFHAFMDNNPAIAWMKDDQGRHVYLSNSYERRFGVRLEDWRGKTDFELWPRETAELFWKNDQEVLAGDRVIGVVEETSDPDGETCYWWNFKFPFQDAAGRRYVGGVGVDITAWKRAEKELEQARSQLEQRVLERTADAAAANNAFRQSEEKYRALVDTSPDGVIMTDLEGRVLFASEQAREMYGADRVEDLLGRSALDFIVPADHQRLQEDITRTVNEGVTRNVESSFVRRNGTYMPGEVSAAVLRDEAGKPMALVVILRDVTERKRAQESLEREGKRLQHMLGASDYERQLIAYDIHDGLAQKIAGALMQFDAFDHLRRDNPQQAADAFQAGMTMLHQSHGEARRLINGLRPPILDESGLVAAIAHLAHEPRGREAPEIEFHSKVHFDRLEGVEENAIYRIVQEGVTNACKHSRSRRVRISLVQRDSRLRIEIRDWGIGFNPKAVLENRFGLTGIRERARLLGGKCRIRSKPGEGTAIIVELPVAERKIEG